nr:hypothetical protein CFP56_58024 [Quercus suber]
MSGEVRPILQRPRLKKRYHGCVEKVKEYLETVNDFDELVSPQSLFLHFLSLEPSRTKTRFSKQKLTETQEKKAKGGLVSGLLSRKRLKAGNASKDDLVVTPPSAHSPTKCLASPTSPLEDDADAAALKAHMALSVDDLSPLMANSSSEVMLSHIQKLVQALGESLFVSRKLLDFEKKVATSGPMIKSVSAENEMLKNKVVVLNVEAKNDKERVWKRVFKWRKIFERKWMAKHHLDLDLSGLVMGEVEEELLADRPSEVTAENVMEEATTIAKVTKEITTITPADPTPNEQ